jgi:hypothetical protein
MGRTGNPRFLFAYSHFNPFPYLAVPCLLAAFLSYSLRPLFSNPGLPLRPLVLHSRACSFLTPCLTPLMTLLRFSVAGAHPVPNELRDNPDLYLRAFVVPAYVPAPFVKSSNPSLTLSHVSWLQTFPLFRMGYVVIWACLYVLLEWLAHPWGSK